MAAKVHFASDVIVIITDYDEQLINKKNITSPVNVGDLIIWDSSLKITQDVFEKYLDQYFEYLILSNKTSYKVTGLLTKFLRV